MKKLALSLLFATVAGALTFGAAASLPVSSQNLGSGGVGVVSCDTDGVEVGYTLAPNKAYVIGIVVDGIDANCIGQTIHWAIEDTSSAVMNSGSVAVTSATQDVPFGVGNELYAADIGEVGITIAG
ncbi:MAG: hypothetical protein OES24_05775 [Acidimicrobiia bacterium]|nr:hypothetical protein [Acidimicrobiia bacterium]